MPHHHMVLPHYMGRSREIDVDNKKTEENPNGIDRQDSFSSLSPLQDNIPLLLPQESDGLPDPHSEPTLNGLPKNLSLIDQPTDLPKDSSLSCQNQEVDPPVHPAMKGLVDDLDLADLQSETNPSMDTRSETTSSDDWWDNLDERKQNPSAADGCGEVGPRSDCRCQVNYSLKNG